jgi:short-subunit dehydrogenase
MALKPANYPKETAEFVTPGSTAFIGWATAAEMGSNGEHVIIMARSKSKLASAFKEMTDVEMDERGAYRIVIIQASDVKLDDEL